MRAILTYHSIDDSGSVISTPPSVFREHVSWLSQNARVLSLKDLLADEAGDAGDAFAITFDDGFANFGGAAPWLLDRGLPITLFIVSQQVGGDNRWGGRQDSNVPTLPLLGWADLEQLAGRGISIGAHTRTHPRLTALATGIIQDEIQGSVEDLRERLGIQVPYIAYPYGAVDERVAAVAGSFCAAGVTTRFKALTAGDRPMWLPRLDMYYFRRPGAIERWGTRGFAHRLRWIGTRRRVREAFA